MRRLMPFDAKNLMSKQASLDYILSILKKQKNGSLAYWEIIKQSKLTKTSTLRALEVLLEQNLVEHDDAKNIFSLVSYLPQ